MTIGIAAIARTENAIVLAADRAVTYGDVQGAAGLVKRIKLGHNERWQVLFAGSPGLAEQVVWRARDRLPDLPRAEDVRRALREAYLHVKAQVAHDLIVHPHLIAPRTESVVQAMHDRLDAFRLNCDLVACGFDHGYPVVMPITDFEIADDNEQTAIVDSARIDGFAVIGSGSTHALHRLLWNEPDPNDDPDPLDVVLYRVFDAKVYAEQNLYVGYHVDMWVLVDDPDPLRKVADKTIDELLDRAFASTDDLPFAWLPRHGEKDEGRTGHAGERPENFGQRLRADIEKLIGRPITSYPTWRAQPSSRSRGGGKR